jgi:hypothetical protein
MSRPTLREQLRSGFPGGSLTLNQLWALHELAGDALPETQDPEQRRRDLQKTMASIRRLQQVLQVTLVNPRSQPGGDVAAKDLLTPEGIELLDIVGRFFADLDVFGQAHSDQGPNFRLASSTTLLHWLVLPSIRELQRRAADFGQPRQPQVSFQQIELDEASAGLSSHLFQFAVLRETSELPVTLLDPPADESLDAQLARWAGWSDEEFARHLRGQAWSGGASHGHRRIAWVLGKYDYVLCMRQDFHDQVTEHARLRGHHWQVNLPVALCTNHRKFAEDLRQLERQAGFRVLIRTDTWVESAQLALYGDYATILPSIALRVNPDLESYGMTGLNLPSENVLLVLNPSILRNQVYRRMLSATATTLSRALARGSAPER